MRKIAIANNKGGVAKTTTAYNLASYYAKEGYRVLVIDMDPQGNLTDSLGIQPNGLEHSIYDVLINRESKKFLIKLPQYNHFYLLPSNLESEAANLSLSSQVSRETLLRKALKEVEDDFDICIIDTSPSLSVLTFNALTASDSVYIPLRAGYFELKGASMLIDTIEQLRDDINPNLKINGIILTQFDSRLSISSDTQRELENYFGSSLLETKIRNNVDLGKAPALAQDIFSYAPYSNGAKDYEFLALEILRREGLNNG